MSDKQMQAEVVVGSTALLDALCVCALGWQTEAQHKRYLAANATVLRHARRLQLKAELEALDAEISNNQTEPAGNRAKKTGGPSEKYDA
jgi:hypothetical protein